MPGQAQMAVMQRPADNRFLVELAQTMAIRGEYDQAQSLLNKILESDPDNPAIQAFLKDVQSQKSSKTQAVHVIRPSEIAADIKAIQTSILRYERRNRDLEFLINQLVQENDLLYQLLAKRNRELLELRKKLYGYSDELSKIETPSSADHDRVKEILDGYQDQLVERDRALLQRNQEVSHMVGEINKVNDALKDDQISTDAMDTAPNADDLENHLKEKRDYLIDKSLTVLEKSHDLSSMQKELGGVSNLLKEANARYSDAVKEYDVKIQQLKSDWAQDRSRQQEEMDKLKGALEQKEKELADIQDGAVGQGAKLEGLKEGLHQKDQKLAGTDALILSKDQEIAELKRNLIVKDEQIGRGQKAIGERNATITFAQNKTRDLHRRVVDIHQSLNEGDRALNELKGLIEDLKDRADSRLSSNEAASLKSQIEDLKRQLDGSLQTLQEKDHIVRRLNDELAAAQKTDGTRNQELSHRQQAISELESRLSVAEADKRAAQEDLKESSDKLAMIVDDLSEYKKNADIASTRAVASEQKVYDLGNQMDDQMVAFGQESRFLKETLAHKDQDIVDLKKKLLAKEDQLKMFSNEIEKATRLLNAQSLSRGQEATTPTMPQAQEPDASSADESDWDPSDNDVYSLQKRLSILKKELKFAQEQLAVRTGEAKRLQQDLQNKEQQIRRAERLPVMISNAKRAVVQSKPMPDSTMKEIAKLQKELDLARQDLALTKQGLDSSKVSFGKNQRDAQQKEKTYATVIKKFESQGKELADYKYRLQEKDQQITAQEQALNHETQKTETLKRELGQMNKESFSQRQQSGDKEQSVKETADRLNMSEIRERDYKHQIDDIQGQLRTSYTMIKDTEARMEDLKKQLAWKEDRIAQLESRLMRVKSKTPAGEGDIKEVPASTPQEAR